jgi:methylase of polypeptide subunit release factors
MTALSHERTLPMLLKNEGFEERLSHTIISKGLAQITRIRRWLFQTWTFTKDRSIDDKEMAYLVNELVSLGIIHYFLKHRIPHLPEHFRDIEHPESETTLGSLSDALRRQLPTLLQTTLALPTHKQTIPTSIMHKDWAVQLGHVLDQLFPKRNLPTWFFGDFHQLCIAQPFPESLLQTGKRNSKLRYSRGIHYTPAPLVDFLVSQTLRSIPDQPENYFLSVLDPSCGTGNILIAAFKCLCNRYGLSTHTPSNLSQAQIINQRLDLLCTSIMGSDIDQNAIAWARRSLVLEACEGFYDELGKIDHKPEVLKQCLIENIINTDFLQQDKTNSVQNRHRDIDYIVGGPPFIRLQELYKNQADRIAEYRQHYHSARHGQFDLYMPFVEESLKRLNPNGRLGLSITNSFLRSSSGKGLREFLGENATITQLVEFEDSKVYPDAVTQILLLFADKEKTQTEPIHLLIKGKGGLRSKLDFAFQSRQSNHNVIRTQLSSSVFETCNWQLYPKDRSDWLNTLKNSGYPLSKFCRLIRNGWSSGFDDVFVLKKQNSTQLNNLISVKNRKTKQVYQIESAVLTPIIHGRNIDGFSHPKAVNVAIQPFDFNGSLIDEHQLASEYPKLWAYLLQNKNLLETSPNQQNQPWFAPRLLPSYPLSESILMGPMVSSGRQMTMSNNRSIIAHNSVLQIIPNQELEPYLLLGVLNSSIFSQYIQLLLPTMGFERRVFRLGTIRDFPFPPQERWQTDTAHFISKLANNLLSESNEQISNEQWDKLDLLVKDFYGL